MQILNTVLDKESPVSLNRWRLSYRMVDVMYFVFLLVVLCIGSPVWADEGGVRHKLFQMDKAAALADFNAAQKQACVKALHSRYRSQYTLSGDLTFDEYHSRTTYDRLFWKGKGSLQRGLLFTGPVTDKSGDSAGYVVCYYAMTDGRLDFQNAYVPQYNTRPLLLSRAGGE